jgi:hypothetical protein
MNKHDFYKEIMSQYTFDESKIRRNAKRASSASFFTRNSKWMPLTSAAAVFMIMTVVIFGFVLNSNTPPQLDEQERINNDLLIEALILSGEFSPEQIESYREMTNDELRSFIEQADIESSTVQEDIESPSGSIVAPSIDIPVDIVIVIDPDDPNDLTQPIDSTPVIDPVLNNDDTDVITQPVTEDDNPIEDDKPVTENPETPVIDEPVVPEQIEERFIDMDMSSVASINFINGNRFVLTTGSQILLYEIMRENDGRHLITAIEGFVAVTPQIAYACRTTGTLLITGGDAFGNVTNLYIAESENGWLRQLDTSEIVQKGEEIRSALFKNGEIVMRARGAHGNTIYTASRNGGFLLRRAAESEDSFVILGFTTGGFKYAHITDGTTLTYKYNTAGFSTEEIDLGFAELSGELRFVRSNDGSNFAVITDDGVYIWNASLGVLTEEAIYTSAIRFHRHSSNIFSDDMGYWYVLNGTEINSITEGEASSVTKPRFSNTFRLFEITPTSVRFEVVS